MCGALDWPWTVFSGCERVSVAALEAIVGHYTCACLLRWRGPSVLHHAYASVQPSHCGSVALWLSVAKELMWARALSPLLCTHLHLPGAGRMDSSSNGFGVCATGWDIGVVSNLGRICEKWRFDYMGAICARAITFGALSDPFLGRITATPLEWPELKLIISPHSPSASVTSQQESVSRPSCFCMVQGEALAASSWQTVYASH